ncbi:thioredoxin [Fulvivirgaceae bacterium BMA10]|uniref:Thioredoxin n=1 Tax=Splendidivirga corallicola TaxID=3051826 RepID=A0ABT8KLE2_9BACT|nr:thioredoxin [Fulvivirgaceae bacterium BMA10]
MDVKDFKKDVLDKSHELPVVVDFWAPWCGPCRFLGPVIEELAAQGKDKWILAKVNTDENPELMQQYGIKGIPAVKMFHRGEVTAEFVGALPKHQIEKWLEEYLPDERKEEFAKIKGILEADGVNVNLKALESFVKLHDDFDEAKILLAQHKVFDDPQLARVLVSNVKIGHKLFERAENVRHLVDLMECAENGNPVLNEKIDLVRKALQEDDRDIALKYLIEAVVLDKNYCDELPRKATIALFGILGKEHELTKKYRRQFDMALY